jgi:hypothetical protein
LHHRFINRDRDYLYVLVGIVYESASYGSLGLVLVCELASCVRLASPREVLQDANGVVRSGPVTGPLDL